MGCCGRGGGGGGAALADTLGGCGMYPPRISLVDGWCWPFVRVAGDGDAFAPRRDDGEAAGAAGGAVCGPCAGGGAPLSVPRSRSLLFSRSLDGSLSRSRSTRSECACSPRSAGCGAVRSPYCWRCWATCGCEGAGGCAGGGGDEPGAACGA